MKTSRTSTTQPQEYVIAFRIFVQASGGLAVVYGNQRLELTADEIHALLLGTIDYAKVFGKLNGRIDETLAEIVSDADSRVNGHVV